MPSASLSHNVGAVGALATQPRDDRVRAAPAHAPDVRSVRSPLLDPVAVARTVTQCPAGGTAIVRPRRGSSRHSLGQGRDREIQASRCAPARARQRFHIQMRENPERH